MSSWRMAIAWLMGRFSSPPAPTRCGSMSGAVICRTCIYLRTLADSRALVSKALTVRRAVVIGASFIGLEVAASLRARSVEVQVVAPEKVPMEKILGPELGNFIRRLHESHGVTFHLDTTAVSPRAIFSAGSSGSTLPRSSGPNSTTSALPMSGTRSAGTRSRSRGSRDERLHADLPACRQEIGGRRHSSRSRGSSRGGGFRKINGRSMLELMKPPGGTLPRAARSRRRR